MRTSEFLEDLIEYCFLEKPVSGVDTIEAVQTNLKLNFEINHLQKDNWEIITSRNFEMLVCYSSRMKKLKKHDPL